MTTHRLFQGMPGRSHQLITKSDSTTYDPPLSFLYVGGTGDVAITDEDGNAVTWSAVPAGSIIPMRAAKVLSTDTTATLIVGVRN